MVRWRHSRFLLPRIFGVGILGVGVLGSGVLASACSSPRTSPDSYEASRNKVVAFVNDTGRQLPSHSQLGSETRDHTEVPLGFRVVTLGDTDRELCNKTVAGFAYSKTGDRQPELRTIVDFPTGTDVSKYLRPIAAHWRTEGYQVDERGLKQRFPKVRATAGDYTIYATALTETAGFGSSPKVTLYAVGRCAHVTSSGP